MQARVTKFWSILVVALSDHIIDIKAQAMNRMKLRMVNEIRKIIKKSDFQSKNSNKKSADQANSYRSISDFKPLSNIYSSVKLYQEDFNSNKFQTKKQKIKQIIQSDQKQSKLQDWMIAKKAKRILPQEYPKSQLCNKLIENYSQQALKSIKMFKFQDYCKQNLRKKKSLLFFKQINTLQYRNDNISDSLLYLPDTKAQIAIDIFSILLSAGMQRTDTPYPTVWYIWKFINMIFDQTDDIKQEAYFQLIKQMSSQKLIYYKIFACLCSTVAPPSRLFLPLLNYIVMQSQESDPSPYLSFCFYSLLKICSSPRNAPASMFQLFCISNMRKIPLLISFPRQHIFFMQSYSTVPQILGQLTQLYNLDTSMAYLLYIDGILLEKGCIIDSINKVKRGNESGQGGTAGDADMEWHRWVDFGGYRAFIVLKNMSTIWDSVDNFIIMYNYLTHQYRKGLFLVNNKISNQIGGLIIASEIQIQDMYQFSLVKCLPRRRYQNGIVQVKKNKIESEILKHYSNFTGTKLEARKKIVQFFSKSRAFLTHFFFCNVFVDQQQYNQAWVGIKVDSLLVVEPGSNRILYIIQYNKITQWGKSTSQICLKVDQIGTFHIETNNLDTFISIFTCYIEYLQKQLQKMKKKDDNKKIGGQQSKDNQNSEQQQKQPKN